MTPEERRELLAALSALPYLEGVEPPGAPGGAAERLASVSSLRTCGARETIFVQGEPAEHFFVILAGRVRLLRPGWGGRPQVVHDLGAPASFAEAAVLRLGRYPVSAEAASAGTRLVAVPRTAFLALLASDPRLPVSMLASLCMRLVHLVERVDDLGRKSAGARLAHHLLRSPASGDGVPTVELASPKRDLAEYLGIQPETLSRILARWRARAWIETDGRAIRLLDVDALEAIAAADWDSPGEP